MTKIYATIAETPGRYESIKGDLVLVELPPNCAVDGEPSEMRRDILFLLDFMEIHATKEDEQRIEAILKRYR